MTGQTPQEIAETVDGAEQLKSLVTTVVNDYLAEHRARRAQYARDPALVGDVLRDGNRRANEIAQHTLGRVRAAMGIAY